MSIKWVEPRHSKTQIRKAGDYLIKERSFADMVRFSEAFSILANWRSSHAYPMQSMLMYFRRKASSIDKNAIVVQRLKRIPSIRAKMERETNMKLDRIEDIGGCRIVVNDINQVHRVKFAIVNGGTRNKLRRTRDYIEKPKESGYRGIHLVYQYECSKESFKGLCIELQIRSKIQHSWATAVEVVGTFTNEGLKSSSGSKEWLTFFKLASIAFADIENKKLTENVNSGDRKKLIKYIERLNVVAKLKAFTVTTRHLSRLSTVQKNKTAYFLLGLDIAKSTVKISPFEIKDFTQAANEYSGLEKEFTDDPTKDVVLVSAMSILGLKKAYPNYFADTAEFIKNINQILEIDRKHTLNNQKSY